jgi:hypothetical protein
VYVYTLVARRVEGLHEVHANNLANWRRGSAPLHTVIMAEGAVDDDLTDVETDHLVEDIDFEPEHVVEEQKLKDANDLKLAEKLTGEILKTWCWSDDRGLLHVIRQLPKVRVTRNVLNGSGMMQLMSVRHDCFMNMLDATYTKRCDDLYAGWSTKLRGEPAAWNGVSTHDMGAYDKKPMMLKKRVNDLEKWLASRTSHADTVMATRSMAWILVIKGVYDHTLLHTVTTAQLEEWFPVDGQSKHTLSLLVDQEKVKSMMASRWADAKRRKMSRDGGNKTCSRKLALMEVSEENMLDPKAKIKNCCE